LLEGVKVKLVKVIIWGIFVATMVKLQQSVISKSDEVHHQGTTCYSATVSTDYDKQVCTRGTL